MSRTHPTIAPAIIACIHEGRDPTVHELCETTDRIEAELLGTTPRAAGIAFRPGPAARLFSMRVALAALAGHKVSAASEREDPKAHAAEPQPCARDLRHSQAPHSEHPAVSRTASALGQPPRISHHAIGGQEPRHLGA